MDDKIIVTNRSALSAKYGAAGLAQIGKALDALVAADAKRGITTRVVHLDDAAAMKRFGAAPVADRKSPKQNKAAIDAVFTKTEPDYLMILGSTDVVPHQDLKTPLIGEEKDDDPIVFGDLPYACKAAYSREITKFKGPTRVVGRLPDLTGAREPSHLLKLLEVAAGFKPRPAADYAAYFGLSTASWQKSTALSLEALFGNAKALQISPPRGPRHTAARLAALSHFINCHGGDADPEFFGEEEVKEGEESPDQPPAHSSKAITGKIKPATVAAVECCYGAQLYDSVTLALPLPICQNYLAQGAYGYFGSTTIAYGPADETGVADVITQAFMKEVLAGASLGRAALVARQAYVDQASELDPIDLKTLAQFNLLGDPSLHPVQARKPAAGVPRGMANAEAERQQRHERRAKLKSKGAFLQASKPSASQLSKASTTRGGAKRSSNVMQALQNICREAGFPADKAFDAFDVLVPPAAALTGGAAAATRSAAAKAGGGPGLASRYYVAISRRPKFPSGAAGLHIAAVAKEVNGRIVGYRIYSEK